MSVATAPVIPRSILADSAEPAWDVARLFPAQGAWSEEEYLALETNHLVEFSNGLLEVEQMPTQTHQFIVLFLCRALERLASIRKLRTVLVAPLRVRLWPGKYREPDVVFMLHEHADRRGEDYWDGADLVMEVVSSDDRARDLETKRREYAQARIPEYWIVDMQDWYIDVLTLQGASYTLHGLFSRGDRATSVLLPGFEVSVDDVFDAANASQ